VPADFIPTSSAAAAGDVVHWPGWGLSPRLREVIAVQVIAVAEVVGAYGEAPAA
jgi:hypothetical protein